ncbi:MAG: hypothetical protein Q8P01_06020 [bacterium]|nr:hypothetical protein [bacterium]
MKKYFIVIGIIIVAAAAVWLWYGRQSQERINADLQKKAEQVDPWLTKKADEVVIDKLSTGEQIVKNNTQGYEVTLPSDWLIEKPSGGDFGFRALPPQNEKGCGQILVHKWPNPDSKTAEQFFREKTDVGEVEYTIKPYSGFEGAILVDTTGLIFPFAGKELYIPKKGFIYNIAVVSDPPLGDNCADILIRVTKSLSIF